MEKFIECPSCGLKQDKTFAFCLHCGAQFFAVPQPEQDQYPHSIWSYEYDQRIRTQIKDTFPFWVMKTALFIIILNNIGWILVFLLYPFPYISYILTPDAYYYEKYFTPIWGLMTDFCFLSDILGFSVLGISLILLKQSTEGSGEDQSLLFAGGSFFMWSVLAILWRFLGPLTLGYPTVGYFGTEFRTISIDSVIIGFFLTNGFVMLLGTYSLKKTFETKLLLGYGILNLIGVILFVFYYLNLLMGNTGENLLSFFTLFLSTHGLSIKSFIAPCFGIVTFTRI
ncbi:MAG: hypothetical protein ACFE9L_20385 [Candidatus Hodarchaeota archaeon]